MIGAIVCSFKRFLFKFVNKTLKIREMDFSIFRDVLVSGCAAEVNPVNNGRHSLKRLLKP